MVITGAISNYVDQKMNDVLKFIRANDPKSVSVYFEIEKTTQHHQKGSIFRAEANLSIDGKMLRTDSTQEDLYSAIDAVKEELIRIVKENQDKKRTLLRKGGAQIKKLLRGFNW